MTIEIRPLNPASPPTAEWLLARRPHTVWFSPTILLAGFGLNHHLSFGPGVDRFRQARQRLEEWDESHARRGDQAPGPFAFASFTFDPDSPQSVLSVPELVVAITADRSWTVAVDGAGSHSTSDWLLGTEPGPILFEPDRPRFAGSSLPDHLWLEAVAEVGRIIASGQVEKVVLARDHALWSKQPFDPHRVLVRLHRRFPDCYTFLAEGLVGASPELLIRRRGSQIDSVTLAGTARRGQTNEDDELAAKELLTSDKTLLEHALAADAVGRVLGAMAPDLSRPPKPQLMRLANLQHLATPFSGTMDRARHVLELVEALHPTPAVGGVPTAAALELIQRLEGMDRGRYAGPIGYFTPDGDGEFAIALRCAELSGARARLFAGNGLVAGSVPEEELEETRLKLAAMLSSLE